MSINFYEIEFFLNGINENYNYRKSSVVQQALQISLAWYLKNYVRVCRKVFQLSPLLAMAISNNLSSIRR